MTRARILITAALLLLTPAASATAQDGFGGGEEISLDTPTSVAVSDFNRDGLDDLVAVSTVGGYAIVRLGQAGGGFVVAPRVYVGNYPAQAAVADFNADGKEDLVIPNVGDKDLSVRLGAGDGTFTNKPDVAVSMNPGSVAVGDFNGDGKDDLAVANRGFGSAQVSVRLGLGDGTFTSGGDLSVDALALVVGEFNSDANEDIVFGVGQLPGAGGLLTGTGGGAFAPGTEIALPGHSGESRGWAVGDFNADGRDDLVAAMYAKDAVAVRLGKGDGSFDAVADAPAGDSPVAVAVGDLDSDGNEDLALANYDSDTVSVRHGDGAGGFANAPDVSVGDRPVDVAIADFDADGKQDLAVANAGGNVSVRGGVGAPPLAGNLLVNGGFEGAGATGLASATPPIPGWERTGDITFARYGLPSHVFFPPRLDAPRYGGGASLLWGGNSSATAGRTEAFQTVDVSGSARSIDVGFATARLSAYLGGALSFPDRMTARVEFLAGSGVALGSFELGPVTAADRNNSTTLLRRAGSAPVPSGTRRIRVALISRDEDHSYSSALADNVKLTLDAPEPPAPASAFGPDTGVTIRLVATRIDPRRPVRVRVRNRNPFPVSGSLGGRRLRPARLVLTPNGSKVLRLRMRPQLRRQLTRERRLILRLRAVVRDPAGNTRTVRKRARVRAARRR